MSSKSKKAKGGSSKGGDSDDGNKFAISNTRFVTVSEFKGKVRVDIREFYNADGELRPGKKGISLSLPEWQKLRDHMDDIEKAIKKEGGLSDTSSESESD